MTDPNIVATIDADISISEGSTIEADLGVIYNGGGTDKIFYNTTEYWNSRPTLISKQGYIYIYSDYKQSEGENIAGIKIGDGTSYLIDMPFIDKPLDDHIADAVKHVTSTERDFWNNKVRCFIDPDNSGNLIFTTQ